MVTLPYMIERCRWTGPGWGIPHIAAHVIDEDKSITFCGRVQHFNWINPESDLLQVIDGKVCIFWDKAQYWSHEPVSPYDLPVAPCRTCVGAYLRYLRTGEKRETLALKLLAEAP